MYKGIYTHGALALCAVVIAGTAAAAYLENGDRSPAVLEMQTARADTKEKPIGEPVSPDSYRWNARLDQFDAFATPGMEEYGRTVGIEADNGAPAIVPEPGSMILLASGLAALAMRRVRRAA